MNAIKELKAGKEVAIDYTFAIYTPKNDTVIIDCEIGCCYHEMSLEDFKDIYCNPDGTLKDDK